MRVNEEGALLLERLLIAEQHRLETERQQFPDQRSDVNKTLFAVRRVQDEVQRVLDEMEWR